jgi:hypothetical protein
MPGSNAFLGFGGFSFAPRAMRLLSHSSHAEEPLRELVEYIHQPEHAAGST